MRLPSWSVSTLLALAIAGCAGSARNATRTAHDEARAALSAYVEGFWVRRDATALGRALSPTMRYHYLGRIIPGDPASHRSYLRDFGAAFPDLAASIDTFVSDGHLGAAVTSWTGTHTGALCGVAPTGRRLSWTVNYIFRLEAGRIVDLWEEWNEAGFYLQLGKASGTCE